METLLFQMKIIKSSFAKSIYELSDHRDANGNVTSCCLSANGYVDGAAFASSSSSGILGILEFMSHKFSWGYRHCGHTCEALCYCDELDCTSSVALALKILRKYLAGNVHKNDENLDVVLVEIILKSNKTSSKLWRRERAHLGDMNENCRFTHNDCSWIQDDCHYHQCVGILNKGTRQLSLWDFGIWLLKSQCGSGGSGGRSELFNEDEVLSMKVTRPPSASMSASNAHHSLAHHFFLANSNDFFLWDGVERMLSFDEWADFLDLPHTSPKKGGTGGGATGWGERSAETWGEDKGDCMATILPDRNTNKSFLQHQVRMLAHVYKPSCLRHSTMGVSTAIDGHFGPHCATPTSVDVLSTEYKRGEEDKDGSGTGGRIGPHPSPQHLHEESHQSASSSHSPHSDLDHHSEAVEIVVRKYEIFISGCHMGFNCSPGVGVARSIRTAEHVQAPWRLCGDGEVSSASELFFLPVFEMVSLDSIDNDFYTGAVDPVFCRSDPLVVLKQVSDIVSLHFDCSHYTADMCVSDLCNTESALFCGLSMNEVLVLKHFYDDIQDRLYPASASASAGMGLGKSDPSCLHATSSTCLGMGTSGFFIPCSDTIVFATAIVRQLFFNGCLDIDSSGSADPTVLSLTSYMGIFSPPLRALVNLLKPQIKAATQMGCFSIPEFLLLDDATCESCVSIVRLQQFCEKVGYPVLVKGKHSGASICSSWNEALAAVYYLISSSASAQGGFLQRVINGVEKGLAFAAVEGELVGCVMMTKTSYSIQGKVWSGDLSAVPLTMVLALEELVREYRWTGGGEIEFVETLNGTKYVIDFNPRFPAWIFASCYATCNLVHDMVTRAILKAECEHCKMKHRDKLLSVLNGAPSPSSFPCTDQCSANLHQHSFDCTERYRQARCAFTRSIVEIPRANITTPRRLLSVSCQNVPFLGLSKNQYSSTMPEKKSSPGDASHLRYCNEAIPITDVSKDAFCVDRAAIYELATICRAASTACHPNGSNGSSAKLATPLYILCPDLVVQSLNVHSSMFTECMTTAKENFHVRKYLHSPSPSACDGSRNGDAEGTPALQLQLCVSVKTQPHTSLLAVVGSATKAHAECITLEEVRAAIHAGFSASRVVLTGPGKFWNVQSDAVASSSHNNLLHTDLHQSAQPKIDISDSGVLHLSAIFADSIADLRTIIARIRDGRIATRVIGLRLGPVHGAYSRFGVNLLEEPLQTLKDASLLIAECPEDMSVGVHFHFSPTGAGMGMARWFGLAKSFVTLASTFSILCKRPLSILDFGGGWSPHFMEGDESRCELTKLMGHIYDVFSSVSYDQSLALNGVLTLPTVQFEPGKSISERSGAVICRVLEVRETNCKLPMAGLSSPSGPQQRAKAVVVDTSVADISSPHSHALFWKPASAASAASGYAHAPDEGDRGGGKDGWSGWTPLSSGGDIVWGRSCMEFDIIERITGVALPATLGVGDFLLIACCGAYDMSMQYDFANGAGRKIQMMY